MTYISEKVSCREDTPRPHLPLTLSIHLFAKKTNFISVCPPFFLSSPFYHCHFSSLSLKSRESLLTAQFKCAVQCSAVDMVLTEGKRREEKAEEEKEEEEEEEEGEEVAMTECGQPTRP